MKKTGKAKAKKAKGWVVVWQKDGKLADMEEWRNTPFFRSRRGAGLECDLEQVPAQATLTWEKPEVVRDATN